MVAREDIPSKVPDLVVAEVNSDDEVSEQASPYVNAVYFVNWYVTSAHTPRRSPANCNKGYLWSKLPANEPSRFSADSRALCLHECESRWNSVSLHLH